MTVVDLGCRMNSVSSHILLKVQGELPQQPYPVPVSLSLSEIVCVSWRTHGTQIERVSKVGSLVSVFMLGGAHEADNHRETGTGCGPMIMGQQVLSL